MKKFDCFIFDFDGTLADSRLNIANSFNYALKLQNFKPISNNLIYPLIGKLNIKDTFGYFYPQLIGKTLEKTVQDFRSYQKDHAQQEIKLFGDVIKTLNLLKSKNKYLSIVTTKQVGQINHITKLFNINKLFYIIFGLGLKKYTKPQRECFDFIFSQLKSPPPKEKWVMVGDSLVDCKFAKNARIDMIGVSYGVDSPKQMKLNGAFYVINTLVELLKFT